jgi:poly(3-hydroxybutyrate) depolymerase
MLLLSAFAGNAVAAKPLCGNNICEGNESKSCPTDCGDDPPPPPPPPEPAESCGCSGGLSSSEAKAGRTYVRDLDLGPDLPTTKYEVRLPSNYDVNRPGGTPVLVYLHGWGGSFRSLPASAARHAKNNGYIVVTPTGFGDGGRNSWNGFRSARLPNCSLEQGYADTDCDAGPRGPGLYSGTSTCVDLDNSQHNYCYDSCKDASGNCPKWDGTDGADNTWNSFDGEFEGNYTCYWTTCLDSVAQIEKLLNEVEKDYCVDRSMIWVTGCSNGGMFVYELAKDPRTSERFAGYLPQVGSPHPGFEQYRSNPTLLYPPKYLMGFWGESDTTVPGRENFPSALPEVALDTNFNGWLYMPARSIVSQWAAMNGLPASPASYDASQYSSSLSCHVWEDEEDPESAEIVECFFQGGHSCPGFGKMSTMMWDFAQDHPKHGLTEAVCP